MENKYSNEQLEKIKNLVKTVEDMKLVEPYKTETYKMMLAQVLGKSAMLFPQEEVQHTKPVQIREKRQKSSKIGRGNKSEFLIKTESLLNTNFFDTPKTMRDVQEKLREMGYNSDLNQISPIMLFFVREQKLKRTMNEKKRFTYFKDNNPSGHSNNKNANSNSS